MIRFAPYLHRTLLLPLALLAAAGGALAQDTAAGGTSTQISKRVVIEIDIDTLDFRVIGPIRGRDCQLCTRELEQKLGKNCERAAAAQVNICQGLVNATVQDLNQIMLLRSRKNPTCITIATTIVGGTVRATQLCYCLPTDPAGSCPAAMWVQ
jgi:hypothetical protein